jgi:invasion protein IalB
VIKSKKNIILLSIIFSSILSCNSFAKTQLLETHKFWKAYVSEINNNKTCFMTSEPINTVGKFDRDNRGKAYVFVTNIKGGSSHEVSVKAGFNFKNNNDVIFDVDNKKTKLFPVDDRAWSESSKVDRLLVQSMRKGKKLIISGKSSPGNTVVDTYSLSGFTKALRIIDKQCS